MRALLLLALALPALADNPRGRFQRICERGEQGRSSRGLACDAAGFFEFATAGSASLGADCACSATVNGVTRGVGQVPISVVRSTPAWCTRGDFTMAQCAANQIRVMPGRPGVASGIFTEWTATNDAQHNRDLSQAIWTKTNMTCTKTATGPDGVANSASVCTASAANGTVTQAIVRASNPNATSFYVRRRTGTGAVSVTRDGVAFTAITSSLDANWKRVVCVAVEGCIGGRCIVVPDMCATSTNPTIGLQIATSGDAVDVDLAQNELSQANVVRPTSPITTAGAAAPRNFDDIEFSLGATLPVLTSWRAGLVGSTQPGNTYIITPEQTAAPTAGIVANGPIAGADQYNIWSCLQSGIPLHNPGVELAAGGVSTQSCAFTPTSVTATASGFPAVVTGSFTPVTGITKLRIGQNWFGSSTAIAGVVSDVCIDDGFACAGTSVAPRGQHIVWIGDSITRGNNSSPTFPTNELYRIYGQQLSKSVQCGAYAGGTVANMRATWNAVRGFGYGSLVFLGGVNSLAGGMTATAIWADYEAVLNDAKAQGLNVTPVTVLPWGLNSLWTPAKQTETLALNALIQAWCVANGETCVDAYTAFGQPGTPQNLAAAYDVGDGVHPNAAGSALLASLVAAAAP